MTVTCENCCHKQIFSFISYTATNTILYISNSIRQPTGWFSNQQHKTRKQFTYSLYRSSTRPSIGSKCYARKYQGSSILWCCHSASHPLQVIQWSTLSYQQRCSYAVDLTPGNSALNLLPFFLLLLECIFTVSLVKKKLFASYYVVVAQLMCTSLGLYWRKKVPKRVDEFDKILKASTGATYKREILEPIVSASQTARQSMSFIANGARDWLRDGVKYTQFSETLPQNEDNDRGKSIENLNASIYASSREEWENEEELFDSGSSMDSVVEKPTNEPTVVRKEGSMYSMVFSTTKLASQNDSDTEKPSIHTPCDQSCKQEPAPQVSDEDISISPPNLWHSVTNIFSFVTVVIRFMTTMFQVLIMIFRDIWFRSNPKFKTRALFYPAVVSDKETILSFNKSWCRLAKQFGYFPEYEYANDKTEEATWRIDMDNASVKESLNSFIEDLWKNKNKLFFWKSAWKPFQDWKQ